jgi:hypothetical protein
MGVEGKCLEQDNFGVVVQADDTLLTALIEFGLERGV